MPVMKALCTLLCHHLLPEATSPQLSNPTSEADMAKGAAGCEVASELRQHVGRMQPNGDGAEVPLLATAAHTGVGHGGRDTVQVSLDIGIAQESFKAVRGMHDDQAAAARQQAESRSGTGADCSGSNAQHVDVSVQVTRDKLAFVDGASRINVNGTMKKEGRSDTAVSVPFIRHALDILCRDEVGTVATAWQAPDVRDRMEAIRTDLGMVCSFLLIYSSALLVQCCLFWRRTSTASKLTASILCIKHIH